MEQEPFRFLPQCLQLASRNSCRHARAEARVSLRCRTIRPTPSWRSGLSGFFYVVLCAQAPEANVFNPDPRGLLLALKRLGTTRSNVSILAIEQT
jgi:hypothetical protein